METLVIKPQGVCSREIQIQHENGIIKSMKVIGGCAGNLQGLCRLVEGMKIEDVAARLEGIQCRGSRTGDTSCPDQLSRGLKQLIK